MGQTNSADEGNENMNGYKGYQASDASENPERGEVVLSLQTVQRMLALVRPGRSGSPPMPMT